MSSMCCILCIKLVNVRIFCVGVKSRNVNVGFTGSRSTNHPSSHRRGRGKFFS